MPHKRQVPPRFPLPDLAVAVLSAPLPPGGAARPGGDPCQPPNPRWARPETGVAHGVGGHGALRARPVAFPSTFVTPGAGVGAGKGLREQKSPAGSMPFCENSILFLWKRIFPPMVKHQSSKTMEGHGAAAPQRHREPGPFREGSFWGSDWSRHTCAGAPASRCSKASSRLPARLPAGPTWAVTAPEPGALGRVQRLADGVWPSVNRRLFCQHSVPFQESSRPGAPHSVDRAGVKKPTAVIRYLTANSATSGL